MGEEEVEPTGAEVILRLGETDKRLQERTTELERVRYAIANTVEPAQRLLSIGLAVSKLGTAPVDMDLMSRLGDGSFGEDAPGNGDTTTSMIGATLRGVAKLVQCEDAKTISLLDLIEMQKGLTSTYSLLEQHEVVPKRPPGKGWKQVLARDMEIVRRLMNDMGEAEADS